MLVFTIGAFVSPASAGRASVSKAMEDGSKALKRAKKNKKNIDDVLLRLEALEAIVFQKSVQKNFAYPIPEDEWLSSVVVSGEGGVALCSSGSFYSMQCTLLDSTGFPLDQFPASGAYFFQKKQTAWEGDDFFFVKNDDVFLKRLYDTNPATRVQSPWARDVEFIQAENNRLFTIKRFLNNTTSRYANNLTVVDAASLYEFPFSPIGLAHDDSSFIYDFDIEDKYVLYKHSRNGSPLYKQNYVSGQLEFCSGSDLSENIRDFTLVDGEVWMMPNVATLKRVDMNVCEVSEDILPDGLSLYADTIAKGGKDMICSVFFDDLTPEDDVYFGCVKTNGELAGMSEPIMNAAFVSDLTCRETGGRESVCAFTVSDFDGNDVLYSYTVRSAY
jgi:hypothetical protein